MKLFFSISQIPELAGLTRHQRKAVYQCAMEAFYFERPSRVWFGAPWILGGMVGGILVGVIVVAVTGLSHSKLLVTIICGLAGAIICTFIGGQFHCAQLRPYLRRVLEERRDELARIK